MFKGRWLIGILIAAALLGPYAYYLLVPASSIALKAPVVQAAATIAPADAQTTAIVTAAQAFLGTLDDGQKKTIQFDFKDATQRANWSNFPLGGPGANRKGVRWADMTDVQHQALMDLLGAVLSPRGLTMVREQVAADDIVAANEAKAGTGSSFSLMPKVSFGSAYYFVSFLGMPSPVAPWMLQFGGHHLGLNATIAGSNVTLSPSFTGGQPQKFTFEGKPVYIVEEEVNRAGALMASLTDAQRAKAVIGTARLEMLLGPGQDGMTLPPQGLPGAEMTDAQKTAFVALIEARLGMLNADDLAPKMADATKNLDKTTFAWSGPAAPIGAGYFRVTGPTVLIEYSPETRDGDPVDHTHSIYRDPTNEYGAAWASLK
jgi:Protein of unknown function (DUF3500)